MKTQGEIEAAVCEGISRFEQEGMGRGPKDTHAHLNGDLLVVRLQFIETARPVPEAMVESPLFREPKKKQRRHAD